MLDLSQDFVDKLNAQYSGGRFVKTVILTESYGPTVNKYWADYEDGLTFNGNFYEPLRMKWEGLKTSQGMPTEGSSVTVSNLGNQAIKYVKILDITGNDVVLRLLHEDLLDNLTGYWQRKLKVIGVSGDPSVATFVVGRQLGKNKLPRKVFLKSEFPGLSSDVARIL